MNGCAWRSNRHALQDEAFGAVNSLRRLRIGASAGAAAQTRGATSKAAPTGAAGATCQVGSESAASVQLARRLAFIQRGLLPSAVRIWIWTRQCRISQFQPAAMAHKLLAQMTPRLHGRLTSLVSLRQHHQRPEMQPPQGILSMPSLAGRDTRVPHDLLAPLVPRRPCPEPLAGTPVPEADLPQHPRCHQRPVWVRRRAAYPAAGLL